MIRKNILMIGLCLTGVAGVTSVAIAGQNGLALAGTKASLATPKTVTLNADTHASMHFLGTTSDDIEGFPYKDLPAWQVGYIGEQNSSSRINFQYYTMNGCTYNFGAEDCLVEARIIGELIGYTREVCEWNDEMEDWECLDEDCEEGDEGATPEYETERFWFFVGLNNIQSFSMTYSL